MEKLKTCPKCQKEKPIHSFIKNRKVNIKCDSCTGQSKLFISEIVEEKKEKIFTKDKVTDLLIHSIDRSDTLFLIRANGTEITVKHSNGLITHSNFHLYDDDKKLIYKNIQIHSKEKLTKIKATA